MEECISPDDGFAYAYTVDASSVVVVDGPAIDCEDRRTSRGGIRHVGDDLLAGLNLIASRPLAYGIVCAICMAGVAMGGAIQDGDHEMFGCCAAAVLLLGLFIPLVVEWEWEVNRGGW